METKYIYFLSEKTLLSDSIFTLKIAFLKTVLEKQNAVFIHVNHQVKFQIHSPLA